MSTLRLLLIACLCGALVSPSSAVPPDAHPTPSVAKAREQAALPSGHWLALGKRELSLVDAAGQVLTTVPAQAEQIDSRPTGRGALVALLDTETRQPLLYDVNLASARLTPAIAPAPTLVPEALCLYRDAQALDHLFLIGKDGQAEQWLLSGPAPQRLRQLALPPQLKRCRTDDARGLLLVDEPGVGTWAYAADGEGVPSRTLLGGKKAPRIARHPDSPRPPVPIVVPQAQTDPVARRGDAADDPALWIHPGDVTRSLVLATNKKQGMLSYDLQGRQRQLVEAGRLNNVDIRQGVRLGDRTVDVAIATQRDEHALAVFEIDADGQLRDVGRIATGLQDVYGTCLYRPFEGGLEAFVNDKDGRFEHYRIERTGDVFGGKLLRRFSTATQPEGCVVDDKAGRLFYGEEDRGIWVMAAAADARGNDAKPRLILPVGRKLVADVEGLALYRGARASYLVASSQGNDSYVVLDAAPPYRYRGAFRIGINADAGIDGASETDGLDVTAVDLGGPYIDGMLVVQDGYKRLPDDAQNFKYVAWRDIARALGL